MEKKRRNFYAIQKLSTNLKLSQVPHYSKLDKLKSKLQFKTDWAFYVWSYSLIYTLIYDDMLSLSKLLFAVVFAWSQICKKKFLKRKERSDDFIILPQLEPHAYRSLKRKSQCQLWSLQWSIQSFLNVIFEQPSSFLQVQSTNNCLWVSQSYPKYGKYVFYPKIREPTSSCIWQIMPAAERIYHIYMLRYLCEPNWWS